MARSTSLFIPGILVGVRVINTPIPDPRSASSAAGALSTYRVASTNNRLTGFAAVLNLVRSAVMPPPCDSLSRVQYALHQCQRHGSDKSLDGHGAVD